MPYRVKVTYKGKKKPRYGVKIHKTIKGAMSHIKSKKGQAYLKEWGARAIPIKTRPRKRRR